VGGREQGEGRLRGEERGLRAGEEEWEGREVVVVLGELVEQGVGSGGVVVVVRGEEEVVLCGS